MYRSGGLAIADALLDRDPALVPGRVEMATVLVSRNAQLIEDAQVAGDAYRSVLGRVTRGHEQARALRVQARAAGPSAPRGRPASSSAPTPSSTAGAPPARAATGTRAPT